ncbi:hypothetical protein CRM22_006044 [Opisthorchis felineus]|uniref:Uncharacterized protein n=1 Tax=Opisthorchis felineus TaxID=147828 RepID=A0A4S2LU63_OPIFE|nr:hypothetical protein CRM22_006044 [Opisthorchis felineus]
MCIVDLQPGRQKGKDIVLSKRQTTIKANGATHETKYLVSWVKMKNGTLEVYIKDLEGESCFPCVQLVLH